MIRRYRPQDSNLDPAFGLYCGPHHFVEPGFELHTHDFIEMVIVLRGSGLHLSAAQLKTVARQVDGINQELHSRQPGYLAMVKAAWQQLLTWLCRVFSQLEDAPTGFARLADIIAYMEQHYAESLSLGRWRTVPNLERRVNDSCLQFCVAYCYTGYPMIWNAKVLPWAVPTARRGVIGNLPSNLTPFR